MCVYINHISGYTHSTSAAPPKIITDCTVLPSHASFPILCSPTAGTVSCLCEDLGTSSTLQSSLPEDVTHIFTTQMSLTPTATHPLDFIW